MKNMMLACVVCVFASAQAFAADAELDYVMVNKIMDEGVNRSEVMETALYLSDVIGPRLTNSPGMREAARWTRDEFSKYGLKNAQLEPFDFGRGWSFDSITVHMTEPRRTQLQALPISWYPGTDGVVEAEIILAVMEDENDFETYAGKLAGKIVLISEPGEFSETKDPSFVRFNDKQLDEQKHYQIPDQPENGPSSYIKEQQFMEARNKFLDGEGARTLVMRSRKDNGLIAAEGGFSQLDYTPNISGIALASEDYELLVRLLKRDKPVKLAIDVTAQYYDDDHNGQNVWAEIPGRGSRPEIVIAGAHLDSWFMGDGANDNGTGTAVVMEAARILMAVGARPKRTIRFALWDAEEQGIMGSLHHVEKHFASKPDIDDAKIRRHAKADWLNDVWPVQPGRDFERFSAYFNLDTGSGRIRGIWGEGNPAVLPIFERWFEPFHDMGAETVLLNNTYGTDHEAFLAMGLPGFTFIQDPLDYETRVHHSQVDTGSHVFEKDLQQAAIIMASFLWHAAERDERLPRMPIPTKPKYKSDDAPGEN